MDSRSRTTEFRPDGLGSSAAGRGILAIPDYCTVIAPIRVTQAILVRVVARDVLEIERTVLDGQRVLDCPESLQRWNANGRESGRNAPHRQKKPYREDSEALPAVPRAGIYRE